MVSSEMPVYPICLVPPLGGPPCCACLSYCWNKRQQELKAAGVFFLTATQLVLTPPGENKTTARIKAKFEASFS